MTKIKKLSNGAIIIRDAPPPNQQQREIRCQPVSAYRLFMDSYTKGCDVKKYFESDREGHRKWKAMTDAIDGEADSSEAPGHRKHEKYKVSYGSSDSESSYEPSDSESSYGSSESEKKEVWNLKKCAGEGHGA
ncbi:hypothetical protein RIF29_17600 [Crotalaria pallida]|uniref:Uncharacterized protein n=1 Tax=Crotalaria pallida TaxID=3830 RepID=A0AAN9IKG3_CROPI